MPNSNRSGFVTFLAMTALGWGYYVLIIYVGLWASAAFQNHALSLPEYLPYFALALGALHSTETAHRFYQSAGYVDDGGSDQKVRHGRWLSNVKAACRFALVCTVGKA